ncbi:RNA helicase [uncultured Micrococcus sp.]|uniref:DEAD/DEAH box helicase n=1 Tax=uncultured Micrococcus sp. TaxID=114051 RepID=UPI00262E0A25|nr:DEAD/DEAH box helicase [uncultured Micrococcus sp.]
MTSSAPAPASATTPPALLARLDALDASPDADAVFEAFTAWTDERGISLYPAQEEAVLELVQGHNVVLATPTGSGKSLVAIGAHADALAHERVSYYTAPIKALVSEKFFALVDVFGAENVGMVTGDSTVNGDAPIICCTAEILANRALREGSGMDIGTVVMDEFHYYADPSRGWAWQLPLLELPQARFLLMSATLGDTSRLTADLTERTGRETAVVAHAERPIPLSFEWSEVPLQEKVEELVSTRQAPVYVVHFSQLDAVETAQGLTSISVTTKEEKEAIAARIAGFRFSAGFGHTLNRLVRAGIGVHHAGMLPKYRRLVEKLAQDGLLKVICGTDTLGVGINVPIRTVLLTALSKFDGERTRLLQAREFHQIAGRAGRAGYDTSGTVVVQAPEHVIENAAAARRAAAKFASVKDEAEREKRMKQSLKGAKKKSPPQGFVSWGRASFERLVEAEPEPLSSRMQLTHSMLLNILDRPGDPVIAVRRLLRGTHETPARQAALMRQALGIFRELLAAGIVEKLPEPDAEGRTVDLTVDLQADFALNQPLSPFALAALELLDPAEPDHALDVVSVIEATLDPPRQVLSAQAKKAKGEAVAAMKAEGMDYNDRMAALEEVTYPQPLAELLEQQFEVYRKDAPWLAEFELAPKSVVRDMFERAMGFGDYVRFYGIARSEGVLLRYLTDAVKALRHTVPQESRTDELQVLLDWLDEMVKQTDSSLLEEWEDLVAGDIEELRKDMESIAPPAPPRLTDNTPVFRVMVRNALFQRVRLFGDEQDARLAELSGGLSADDWADALDAYFDDHEDIDDSAAARGPELFRVATAPPVPAPLELTGARWWAVRQVLKDHDGDLDHGINAVVDLDASDEAGHPVIRVVSVGAPESGWGL